MKGRVVFLGDRVKDGDGNYAIFEELSSSPAAMSSGKFADAYGAMPGNIIETADGEQAYPQAQNEQPDEDMDKTAKAPMAQRMGRHA